MDISLERILSLIPRKPDGSYVHGAKKNFCESIGAPTNIISEWEAGRVKSYRGYIYIIASVYHVSVEWLRGETDIKNPPIPKEEGLSEEKQKLIEKIIAGTDEQAAYISELWEKLK